jgi:hypothetical protein
MRHFGSRHAKEIDGLWLRLLTMTVEMSVWVVAHVVRGQDSWQPRLLARSNGLNYSRNSMKRTLLLLLLLVPSLEFAQSVRSFTDQDFQKALRDESRVLFYSLSPGMPLSIEGLREVRLAAQDLRASVVVLADPNAEESKILSLADPQIRYQRSKRLRDLGIQLHYPSLLVSCDHKVVGAPIEGFKTRTGYVVIVSDLLKLHWKEEYQVSEPVTLPRPMHAFFKPVYGSDFIVSGNAHPNYLFDLKTKSLFDILNEDWGDPGPSPDGDFVTLLGSRGLAWFSTGDILAGKSLQLLKDPGLRTYQSVGQVSSSQYRVLGALSSSTNPAGLIVRDYESRKRDDGGKTVAPLTEWRKVCGNLQISIPMMSKTGQLLSGSYKGTLRVFRIGANATECEEFFDSKVVAGKADFTRDDNFLVYVSRSENPDTRANVDTIFLADLRRRTAKPIFYAPAEAQLAFPGFMSPDRIVVYDLASRTLNTLEKVRRIQWHEPHSP